MFLNPENNSKYILKEKVAKFFSEKELVTDKDVHDFALSEKIEPSEFEEVIYELLTSFFNAGKSKEVKVDVSKELLEKEIEVEMEHTTCKIIAEKIVRDHLAENEKYYEFLDKMENEMKNSEQK